jgi:hypothetical protein
MPQVSHTRQNEPDMKNRHIISYVLFILGIVLLLALGLTGGRWFASVVLGLAFAIVGVIFYRRGK